MEHGIGMTINLSRLFVETLMVMVMPMLLQNAVIPANGITATYIRHRWTTTEGLV